MWHPRENSEEPLQMLHLYVSSFVPLIAIIHKLTCRTTEIQIEISCALSNLLSCLANLKFSHWESWELKVGKEFQGIWLHLRLFLSPP